MRRAPYAAILLGLAILLEPGGVSAGPSGQCRPFSLIQPSSAIRHRLRGQDALLYLDAVQPGIDPGEIDTVFVVAGRNVFGGAALVPGHGNCAFRPFFLSDLNFLNAEEILARSTRHQPASEPDLRASSARGDTQATALLGLRAALAGHADRAALDQIWQGARSGYDLAMLVLAVHLATIPGAVRIDKPEPVPREASTDRAAARCWLALVERKGGRFARQAGALQRRLGPIMSDGEKQDAQRLISSALSGPSRDCGRPRG